LLSTLNPVVNALFTTNIRHLFTNVRKKLERLKESDKRKEKHSTKHNKNRLSNREKLKGKLSSKSRSRIKSLLNNLKQMRIKIKKMKITKMIYQNSSTVHLIIRGYTTYRQLINIKLYPRIEIH